MAILFILILLPFVFPAPCQIPGITECGCVKRPTFDQNWLQENHPDIAAQDPTAQYTLPDSTYTCYNVTTVCPTGSVVVAFNGTRVLTDARKYPNPTVVRGIECRNGIWYKAGLTEEIQQALLAESLSCMVQN